MPETTLVVPATDDAVEAVHEALEQAVVAARVSESDRARFETGVIEIVGNILEHAFLAEQAAEVRDRSVERSIRVWIGIDDDELVAVLGDDGRPVELDLSAVAMPDAEAESGRGLALALAAVDDLHYERVDGCNTWTVRCRRATP